MAEDIDLNGDPNNKKDSNNSEAKDETAKTEWNLHGLNVFGNMMNSFGGTKISNEVVHEASKVSLKFVYLAVDTFFVSLLPNYSWATWFGAKMVIEEGYTGGEVVTIIMAILNGSLEVVSLGQASPSFTAFAAGQAAAFKMFETIKRKAEIDAYDITSRQLDDICGDIEVRVVCFSYPTRLDELIFNGFSLSIPSGTTTTLVGESGSGKSTVVSLVDRFYDGAIVEENIAYGKDGAFVEEIKDGAELANLSKIIDKLPQLVQVIDVSSSEEDPEEDPEELPPKPVVDALDFPEDDEDPLSYVDSLEDIMSASEVDSTEESGPGGTTNSEDSSS
ncbi:ABC transporter B family member 11-like [Glycine soja]|uniref:ABC transporter B family member 11-like n=1 Tax=Glycine max TaxID=3847 RepID=UPI000719448E|nr:ABC transporter B family member 11-like [Glycine max]XP_028208305.1 ABC transporter B family member 11-like [Glycine soja]|eukprot:XP_014625029.1 ABC transporter B family member 11-like [Glycine max]